MKGIYNAISLISFAVANETNKTNIFLSLGASSTIIATTLLTIWIISLGYSIFEFTFSKPKRLPIALFTLMSFALGLIYPSIFEKRDDFRTFGACNLLSAISIVYAVTVLIFRPENADPNSRSWRTCWEKVNKTNIYLNSASAHF